METLRKNDLVKFDPPRPEIEKVYTRHTICIDEIFDDDTASVSYYDKETKKYNYILVKLSEIKRLSYEPKEGETGVLYFRTDIKIGEDNRDYIYRAVIGGSVTEQDKKDILKAIYCLHIGDDLYNASFEEASKFVMPTEPKNWNNCARVGKIQTSFDEINNIPPFWQVI